MRYINSDCENPKYIFHGSVKHIDGKIEPLNYEDNLKNAVYGTSSFESAVAFAIPKKCKAWKWNFNYGVVNASIIEGEIADDTFGYVYVFNIGNLENAGGPQYVSYEKEEPIDCVKVFYKDYRDLFTFEKN